MARRLRGARKGARAKRLPERRRGGERERSARRKPGPTPPDPAAARSTRASIRTRTETTRRYSRPAKDWPGQADPMRRASGCESTRGRCASRGTRLGDLSRYFARKVGPGPFEGSNASPRSVVRKRCSSKRSSSRSGKVQWGRQQCRPHFCWGAAGKRGFAQRRREESGDAEGRRPRRSRFQSQAPRDRPPHTDKACGRPFLLRVSTFLLCVSARTNPSHPRIAKLPSHSARSVGKF